MSDNQQLLISAERALTTMKEVRDKLSKAGDWGVLDMFGGGLFTSFAKHDLLDDAKRCLQDAQHDLDILREQLDTADFQLDCIDSLKTMDIWFDNIIADIMVQDKIKAFKQQVEQTIYQLQNIIARLKA